MLDCVPDTVIPSASEGPHQLWLITQANVRDSTALERSLVVCATRDDGVALRFVMWRASLHYAEVRKNHTRHRRKQGNRFRGCAATGGERLSRVRRRAQ